MANESPITLEQLFRFWRNLPHQAAAIPELEADLAESGYEAAMRRDRPWFKTWSQAGKQPESVDWRTPAMAIVQEFEGCRLEAYPDPGTGGDPWTIGWGSTSIGGKPVREGQAITQLQADAALSDTLGRFWQEITEAAPVVGQLSANQQAALVSFAYNVGVGAFAESTLAKRLAAGDDPDTVAREELPRWNKGGSGVMAGLVRRRAAEVALFTGGGRPAVELQQERTLIEVPYEAQNDNTSGTGYRECFSSSAAMVARFYGKVTSDDAYNKIRAKFGDTTDAMAQVKALNSLGLTAQFRTNGTVALLERELAEGRPVMVGWLHHGPASRPSGGGHWTVVIGCDRDGFIHNDPNGEADLAGGGYVSQKGGAGIRYSRKNWLPRWLPDGPASGWCLTVKP